MAPQAFSTLKLYAGEWKVFETWCVSIDLDPFQASFLLIADFLLHLFQERKLTFNSIEGYRTAIPGPIKLSTGLDVCHNPMLQNILKSFLRRDLGFYNLSHVLFFLVKDPFEPLSEILLKFLIFNMVFLILLVAGSRRGEICAVKYWTLTSSPNWTNVVLHPT